MRRSSNHRRKGKRCPSKPEVVQGTRPTLGQVNRSIDDLCHPWFHHGPAAVVVDSFLHALVEQNPPRSLEKFLRYNFSPLVRESMKAYRASKRRHGRK